MGDGLTLSPRSLHITRKERENNNKTNREKKRENDNKIGEKRLHTHAHTHTHTHTHTRFQFGARFQSVTALCQTASCDIRKKKGGKKKKNLLLRCARRPLATYEKKKNRKCLAQSLTELKCAVQESLLLHMWTEEGKISLNFFFSKNLLQNTHALCKTLLEDFFFFI